MIGFSQTAISLDEANSTPVLSAYETDGCTGFPDGTFSKPKLWRSCCHDHDLRYWFGGTESEEYQADLNLKKCVTVKGGSIFGNIMYYGVRTGHMSPIKHRYKWGWGWGQTKKDFSILTMQQIDIVNKELNKLNLDQEYLKKFRREYNL